MLSIKKMCIRSNWLWISGLVIILDQLSKYWIQHNFVLGQSQNIFPGFNLTLAYNMGAAFSFLDQAGGWQQWLFVGLAFAISLGLFVWLTRLPTKAPKVTLAKLAIALVIGGAIGNVIDRINYGYVIDFIDVYVKWGQQEYHWPVFNIADSAICVGASLLVLYVLLSEDGSDKSSKSER